MLSLLAVSSCSATENGDVQAPDSALEYRILKELAQTGDARPKFQAFQHVYSRPELYEEYLEEAIDFLIDAARLGDIEAQYVIGYMQLRGELVNQDVRSALEWLRSAGEGGHHSASFWIGYHYSRAFIEAPEGDNAISNFGAAEEWLQRTIQANNADQELAYEAALRLGRMYIAKSSRDERGWKILVDLAKVGYQPAINTIERMKKFYLQLEASGEPKASELLMLIDRLESASS